VNFTNLEYVSQYEKQFDIDRLSVKIKKPELFTNEKGKPIEKPAD
jgi:hypothetical protein